MRRRWKLGCLLPLVVVLLLPCCWGAASHTEQQATHPADVAALLPVRALMRRSNSSWAGWQESRDPCGAASCGQDNSSSSCAWQGVACSGWRVVGLQLACDSMGGCSAPLTGQLPASLTQLDRLINLSLSGNLLTGSLPVWPVGSQLAVLDLRANKLSGPLPDGYALSLTRLQALDLSANELTGNLPWEWSRMSSLVHLDLAGNNLQGSVPLGWASMRALQSLDLADNCGLCGGVPMIPGAKIRTVNTSMGESCNINGAGRCLAYSYSHLMIALSILMGSLALCLLQRHICWRWRVANALHHMRQGGTADLEAGGGGGSTLKPIPSFTATVELSPSHHHIQAPAATVPEQQAAPRRPATAPPTLATVVDAGGSQASGDDDAATAAGAAAAGRPATGEAPGSSGPSRLRALLPQLPRLPPGPAAAGSSGSSSGRPAACVGSSSELPVAPVVLVMPDGQAVALAVRETPPARDVDAGKDGDAAAGDAAAHRARRGGRTAQQRGGSGGLRELLSQVLLFLVVQPIRPEDITAQPPRAPRR